MEDYSNYLSIDNGHGVLIPKRYIYLLEKYHIDYLNCSCLSDLLYLIDSALEEEYDEDLELVLSDLCETHYYQEVKK